MRADEHVEAKVPGLEVGCPGFLPCQHRCSPRHEHKAQVAAQVCHVSLSEFRCLQERRKAGVCGGMRLRVTSEDRASLGLLPCQHRCSARHEPKAQVAAQVCIRV